MKNGEERNSSSREEEEERDRLCIRGWEVRKRINEIKVGKKVDHQPMKVYIKGEKER